MATTTTTSSQPTLTLINDFLLLHLVRGMLLLALGRNSKHSQVSSNYFSAALRHKHSIFSSLLMRFSVEKKIIPNSYFAECLVSNECYRLISVVVSSLQSLLARHILHNVGSGEGDPASTGGRNKSSENHQKISHYLSSQLSAKLITLIMVKKPHTDCTDIFSFIIHNSNVQ